MKITLEDKGFYICFSEIDHDWDLTDVVPMIHKGFLGVGVVEESIKDCFLRFYKKLDTGVER